MEIKTRYACCSEDGSLEVGYALLQEIMSDCAEEVASCRDVHEKIKCLLRTAGLCRTSGYPVHAAKLYRQAWDLAIDDDYGHLRMKNKEFALVAACALNDVWRQLTPDDPRRTDYVKETYSYYHDIWCILYID